MGRLSIEFPSARRVTGPLALVLAALVVGPPTLRASGMAGLEPATRAAAPRAQDRDHVDPRYGFKLRAPKDWEPVPLKLDEAWQVAKYLSDRTYFWTDKNGGWTWEHRPRLLVIAFRALEEEPEPEPAPEPDPDEEEDEEERDPRLNPYRDYKDFLRRTYPGGGYVFSEELEVELEGTPVTQYRIDVVGNTFTGPKRILAWVFHTEDLDLAVEIEVLETEFDKLERELKKCLGSFELIERTEALPDPSLPAGGAGGSFAAAEIEALSPFERRALRQEEEQRLHQLAIDTLPEDWSHDTMGRFLVLNHNSDRVAKKMVERTGALWDWLDENFAFVGHEEYVRRPILRICDSLEEYNAVLRGSAGSSRSIEITSYDDNMGSVDSWQSDRVNQRLLAHWFGDRDRDLYQAMPAWLREGLSNVFGSATPKGRKLEFKIDDWDRDQLRELAREEGLRSPRDLVRSPRASWTGSGGWWNAEKEAGALVRFFLSGDAAKSKRSKDVLPNYIKNLKLVSLQVAREFDADPEVTTPTDDEQQREYDKERVKFFAKAEQRILDEVYERTFGGWSDKDWDGFDKVYFKTIK